MIHMRKISSNCNVSDFEQKGIDYIQAIHNQTTLCDHTDHRKPRNLSGSTMNSTIDEYIGDIRNSKRLKHHRNTSLGLKYRSESF